MKLDRDHSSDQSITTKKSVHARGKNTCEASEIAAAIVLQVFEKSELARFSKGFEWPYDSRARKNAQRRSVVEDIGHPMRRKQRESHSNDRLRSLYSP